MLEVLGTAGDDTVTVTDLAVSLGVSINYTSIGAVEVSTGAGDDTVTVQNSVTASVVVDGGAPSASDQLVIEDNTGGLADVFTYTPGTSVDTIAVSGGISSVTSFSGIEDLVLRRSAAGVAVADQLVLNGTGSDDVFTVVAGTTGGTAQVSSGPAITFANFGTGGSQLALNGLEGDDSFEVTHLTDWLIQTVSVDGGAPSEGDSFHLVGTAGDDTLTYNATAAHSGTIGMTSGTLTTNYNLSNVESSSLDAGAGSDTLTVTTPDATITPGAVPGSGRVDAVSLVTGASLLSLDYENAERAVVSGTSAVIEGTDADDTVTISAAGIVTVQNNLGYFNSVDVSGFTDLVINLLGGDDQVTYASSNTFSGGVTIIGGDNGTGSDELIFNGGGDTITLSLEAQTIAENALATVSFLGIEDVTVNAAAGDVSVTGTAGDDSITVELWGSDEVALTRTSQAVSFDLSAVGTLTVDVTTGDNEVTVVGTTGNDAFTTVSDTQVATTGLETVNLQNLGANDSLRVLGGAGNDTFMVSASVNVPIFVDGGDPIGVSGDSIVMTATGGFVFYAGAENDEGSFVDGGNQPVSFDHLEGASIDLDGNALTVLGTNGDDDITLIGTANDAFDVTINDGLPVSYTNAGDVLLDGQNGDDDIDVDLNGFTLTGTLTVEGNEPSSGGGDTLTVAGAAGVWAASASDGGTLTVDTEAITVQGIENLVFDGEGAGTLTVNGTANDDTFTQHARCRGRCRGGRDQRWDEHAAGHQLRRFG